MAFAARIREHERLNASQYQTLTQEAVVSCNVLLHDGGGAHGGVLITFWFLEPP